MPTLYHCKPTNCEVETEAQIRYAMRLKRWPQLPGTAPRLMARSPSGLVAGAFYC